MKTASSAQIRVHNENLVRRALLERREATRLQLARITGLSQMTVGTLISGLLLRGEVEEMGSVPSEGGRPSTRYRYRAEVHKAAAAYTYQRGGTTYVQLEVYDLFGDLVYRDGQYLETVLPKSFDRLLAKAFERVNGIQELVFGLPGQVDGKRILFCDHPALAGEGLCRRWEELYQVPVVLENDVNAAVLGYVQSLPREKVPQLAAGIYFPGRFWPGMGLALEGRPWPGRRGFVGEFHYLSSDTDWEALDYGNYFLVEQAAAQVVEQACVTVGPERFVLYGDFFRPEAGEVIRRLVEDRFQGAYGLELEIRPDLGPDYETGMKSLALRHLKQTLFGKAWEEL